MRFGVLVLIRSHSLNVCFIFYNQIYYKIGEQHVQLTNKSKNKLKTLLTNTTNKKKKEKKNACIYTYI